MALLQADHLCKSFTLDQRKIPVLEDISLSVEAGEFVVIQGASGSGKTTLLTLLSGLDQPDSGQVTLGGRPLSDEPEQGMATLRNQWIGFVFQSFHLVPSMTALENVMFPAEIAGHPEARQRAQELLSLVGLSHREDNQPSQLSGGEKQRVAICRALTNGPKILFADEPTGNLDFHNGEVVMEQLLTLREREGSALVLVTHNPELAAAADRVFPLVDGRVEL